MKYIVALTGGIGSGKSTVANIFSQFGISIIETDIIAHKMVKPGTPTLKAIIERFTNSIINTDGTLNRRDLREQIFLNSTDKNWLNNLLHPLIYQETKRQLDCVDSPYALLVIPLLIENQLHKKFDRVLLVDVSPETQIQRATQRDNVSMIHAERILSSQATREARLAIADDIIDNNGAPDAILSHVIRLHAKYMQFATRKFLIKNSK